MLICPPHSLPTIYSPWLSLPLHTSTTPLWFLNSKIRMALFLCSFLFFLISSATACDRCVHQTKAAYFSKSNALSCKIDHSFFCWISLVPLLKFRFLIRTQFMILWIMKWVGFVFWIWCSWGLWVWFFSIGTYWWTPCCCCAFPLQRWSWLWFMLSGTSIQILFFWWLKIKFLT